MQKIVQYLIDNPEIMEKVKQGKVSLLNLNEVQTEALLRVLKRVDNPFVSMGFWQ